tara:strand:+ start:99 stop:530 length:432 start_codon:yes stop_codon:yes gene_type:complete
MTLTKQKTCKDLVNKSYQMIIDDWILAGLFCGETEESLKKSGYKAADFEDYLEYERLFDYVNQSALCFDFVKAGTFTDQKVGYYRLQLSYGGPSTEFRIYTDKDLNIDYVEYWYLDWFDGASIIINDKLVIEILEEFLELESV